MNRHRTRTSALTLTPAGLAQSAGLLRTVFAAAAIAGLASPALARGPEGANVVRGSVNIQRNGANTIITAGNGAIINYQSFNIGSGETVRFVQPSANSRVLNRITGPDPSRISGTLIANGMVYIVNPAGVFFAHGSLVNVGGLYAAAGNITNQNFISNVNNFTGLRGTVENRGAISGDAVHLVGAHVANYGAINAPNGMVTMSAGGEVYIGEQGGQIFARVSGNGQGTGVTQAGEINAAGGQVRLGAGDMYAVAIDHPGNTRARDITLQGGRGGVVSSSGRLDASNTAPGGVGGRVELLGDRVGVFGGEINASGTAGGGTVLVGGDYRGEGSVPHAEATFVAPSASIHADATRAGDGGRVVVWSDHYTNFQGHISARGGAEGGNGGQIETSGKERLLMVGSVDAAGPRGRAGSWLLDPTDVTLSNSATSNGTISGAGVFTPDTNANSANVNLTDIVTALQAGTSVTINTASSGAGAGDITLQDPLSVALTSAASLTLNAEHDININVGGGTITSTGAGPFTLNFNAMNDVHITQAISMERGALNITSGGDVALGGLVSIGGASATGMMNVQAGGDIAVSSGLSVSTSLVLRSGTDGAGNITFSGSPALASDSITLRAGDGSGGTNTSIVNAITGSPTFTRFSGAAAPLSFLLRQDADITDAEIPDVAQFGGGAVAGMNYRIVSDAGMVTLSTPAKVTSSVLTLNGATGAAITSSLSVQSLSVPSTLSLSGDVTTTGDQTYSNSVLLGGDTTLTGHNVTFASTVDSSGGTRNLTVTTTGTGTTTFGGAVGGLSALGTLTTNADGATTINSPTVHADVLSFQDDVTIGSDSVLNATTSATFAKTLVSEASEVNDLTINSAAISLQGDIGAAANAGFGLFKTGSGGSTVLDAANVTAQRIEFDNAVTVMQDATLRGSQSIVFRSTLNSEAMMPHDLTLDSPVTNFNASVGAVANGAFGTLTTDAAGVTTLNAAMINAATVDFRDAVVLAFSPTVTGTTLVNFESAIDNRAGQSFSLTVNSPDTRFGGVIGGAVPLNVLTTDMAGTTTISGGSITATTLDFNDAVLLGSATVMSAPAGIHFHSTVDSQGGGGFDLTLTSSIVDFLGEVGMNASLGTLATSDTSQTNLAGGSIRAGSITFRGTTQLRSDSVLTAISTVRFNGAVDSLANQGFSLTIHAPRTSFFGLVGGGTGSSTALGSLTTDGVAFGSMTNLGGVTTLNDQTYNGPVSLVNNTTLNGRNITFGGAVDSITTDHSLTVNTSNNGVTRFDGPVGNVLALSSLMTNADGQTQFGGDAVFVSGDMTFNDKVFIAANTAMSGNNVLFNDTLDSDATPRSLSITATQGNTIFSFGVGGLHPFDSLTVSSGGATRLNGAAVTTMGAQTYNGSTVLGANTTLSGTNITFGGSLNSGANGQSLTINTIDNGVTTFRADVGGTVPLTSLTTNADGTTQLFGHTVRTTGTQVYGDPVLLGATETLTGTDVTFSSTIDSTPLFGPMGLTVNASGVTRFDGAVGATNALRALTTDSAGSTRLASDVHTEGGMAFNDAVTVMNDATLTDTGGTGIAFGSTLNSGGGNHALTLLTNTSSNATVSSPQIARISFNGDVGGVTAFSNLTLGGDRTTDPAAATIVAGLSSTGTPISNFSLVINTTGAFTMGARQKMSVVGGLTINSGGTATLGDISTLGNMNINAPAIAIRTRPGGPNLAAVVTSGSNTQLALDADSRTDFVAGGHISFSVAPTLVGGFEAPAFASPNASGISSNLMQFSQFAFDNINANLFHVGTTYLDLRATGASNVNLATAIAGAVPNETQSGNVPQQAVIGAAEAEQLRELGINTRSADERELAAILSSTPSFYEDVPQKPTPAATDLQVTANRLPVVVVHQVLADYREVFDKDGQPAPEQARQSLRAAWDEYAKAAGDKADPLGFRAYVEAVPAQAQALYYLDGLRTLFSDLGRLGLSPIELRHAKDVILSRVTFPGLSPEGLEAAITARYFGATASAN